MKQKLFLCMLIVSFACLMASAQNPDAPTYVIYYGSSNTIPDVNTYTEGNSIKTKDLALVFTANDVYGYVALPKELKLVDAVETLFYMSFLDQLTIKSIGDYRLYYINFFSSNHETELMLTFKPFIPSYKHNLSSETTSIVGNIVQFNLVNNGAESICVTDLVVKNSNDYSVIARSTNTSQLGTLAGGQILEHSIFLDPGITPCYEWHYTYKGKDFVFCSDENDPARMHEMSFYVDEEFWVTYEYEYGEEIFPEDEPVKEGYTFSGWSEIPKTMPANDVIVMGSFKVNKYTLTYVVDGNTYKTQTLEYGAAITQRGLYLLWLE